MSARSLPAVTPRPAGAILSPPMLEQALLALLAGALEAYLDATAAQLGAEPPAGPRSLAVGGSFERFADDQLPAVIVQVAGIDSFERQAGPLGAWYRVRIGAAVAAPGEAATRQLLGIWLGALLACLAQTPSLGGLASSLALLSANLDASPPEARRSYREAWLDCRYLVDGVVDPRLGPLRVSAPPVAGPLASEVDAEPVRVPIEEVP